jgi:16S rRNA (guanine527-N7)-methyltransferase
MPETILKYFPELSDFQKDKFSRLGPVYARWNSRINVISRKDMDFFYLHHVLHSLSIAKVASFLPGTSILDAGTGGGFPGIPLAILFPDSHFTLLDSIAKKIKVVTEVAEELELKNINPLRIRAEEEAGKYDFIISRAVSEFGKFVNLTCKNISPKSANKLRNGILYLKGGDLTDELSLFSNSVKVWEIKDFFTEPFFETKKIIYLPL